MGIDGTTIIFLAVLIPSVILHEISHGYIANRLGDDTAKKAGRLTLNPIAHIDPIGTLVLPAVLVLAQSPFLFGYAKPVPVRVDRLRRPRLHALLVSLAGPATNFVLASVAIGLFLVIVPAVDSWLWWTLLLATISNVALGFFNMLPIPPLDGSAVIEFMLPRSALRGWYRIRPYSMVLLLAFLLVGRDVLDPAYQWVVDLWVDVAR